jgi:hypothetical protein
MPGDFSGETEDEVFELEWLVGQLREPDPDLRLFGSDSHRYLVGPKLSGAELASFEAEHGIVLPADYRAYLRFVGDESVKSGTGPGASQERARAMDSTPSPTR